VSSQILWQFKKEDKIVQLLLLPYISINSSNNVQTGRFDSTDQKLSLWTLLVSDYARPNINIKINGKRFSGLLDTGSNITIISKHLWTKSWPIKKVFCQIAEISQTKVQEIYQNVQIYLCCCCCYVALVVSDSVRPHRWQPTRLPIPGILQARTLEWVAISFSNAWKWKVKSESEVAQSCPTPSTPWTAAYQGPPSMGFFRQEYWTGCHCLLRIYPYERPKAYNIKTLCDRCTP